jgi:hypothetical protein
MLSDAQDRAHTQEYRSTFSDIYVLNPDGLGNQFDPLDAIHKDRDVQSAATNLLHKSNERDAIFIERAIVMLTQILHAALLHRPARQAS